MKLKFLTFIVGLTGIFAETILLREILILSEGNELVISFTIVSWLIVQTVGAYVTEKLLNKTEIKKVQLGYLLGFLTYFIISIFFVREIKFLLGYTFGQPVGLIEVFFISIVVLFPLGIFHSGLFIILTEEVAISETKIFAINKVYFYELLGTVVGGILLSLVLLQNFDVFKIIFLANIIFCISFLLVDSKHLKLLSIIILFNFIGLTFSHKINFYSIKKFYNQEILSIKNSVYNNIVVTKQNGQKTFFVNGEPYIITPQENNLLFEELKVYSLSLVEKDDLAITLFGNFLGENGFLESLNIPKTKKIIFVEKDAQLIKLYNKYVSKVLDKKIDFVETDIIDWLKKTNFTTDIFFINIGYPKSLYLNRYFTKEFFLLTKKVVSKDGVMIIIFPGNINYMSSELKYLNSNLFITLKSVWKNIFVLPQENENIFFATDDEKDLYQTLIKNVYQHTTHLVTKNYLNYRLEKNTIDNFNKQIGSQKVFPNTNYNLVGMFYGLKYWNLLYSPAMNKIYNFISKIQLKDLYFILFIGLVFVYLFNQKKFEDKKSFVFKYIIFSSGMAGFVGLLLIMFFFQVVKGYIYSYVSLFTAIFFSGCLIGVVVAKKSEKLATIFFAEIMIITMFFIILFMNLNDENVFILYGLTFVLGLMSSLEYNFIAKKLVEENKFSIKKISASLNIYDLCGGIFGGIVLVGLLLPAKGVFEIINFVFISKIMSLLFLFFV